MADKNSIKKPTASKRKVVTNKSPSKLVGAIGVPGGYVKGAWYELRQVRWPDRRATWGLTLAVIIFSLFFAAVILGLDAAFQYLFKEVIL